MNWIPTSERLPEAVDGAFIIVALNYGPDHDYADRYRILDYVAESDNPGWYTSRGNLHSLTTLRTAYWCAITEPTALPPRPEITPELKRLLLTLPIRWRHLILADAAESVDIQSEDLT